MPRPTVKFSSRSHSTRPRKPSLFVTPNLPTMSTTSTLLFIPGLHKLTAPPSRTPATPSHPFCPSRHALVTPPNPNPPARLNPPSRGSRFAPTTCIATPVPPTARSTLPSVPAEPRAGHKHTAESKRKISAANRGNVPWNKGLKHSEETRRKISEATRKAMLSPEMRERLKQRARGRRHSEATKLKIRETARASRGSAKQRKKKAPVPFVFSPDVVAQLNERVQHELDTKFKQIPDHPGRFMVREKKSMPAETREKLSRRIKAMWMDPEYRSKVAEGIEQRQMKLAKDRSGDAGGVTGSTGREKKLKVKNEGVAVDGVSSPRRRARSTRDQELHEIVDDEGVRSDLPVKEEKAEEEEEEDEELNVQVRDQDIVLDTNALNGWTKEELGIFGSHGAGRVTPQVEAVAPLDDYDQGPDLGSPVTPLFSKEHGKKVDVTDDMDLLPSLRDGGQLESMNNEALGEGMVGDATLFELDNDVPFDSLDLRDSTASQTASGREHSSVPDDDVDGFFDGPVDLMSTSAADVTSPFLSISSEVDRMSSTPRDDFGFGGEDNVLGNAGNADFMSNKFSVNYVDDNLGGLDLYDDIGQTFDPSTRSSPLLGFERQGGNFAQNPGKTK